MVGTTRAAGFPEGSGKESVCKEATPFFLTSCWLLPKQEAGPDQLVKAEPTALYAPVPLS